MTGLASMLVPVLFVCGWVWLISHNLPLRHRFDARCCALYAKSHLVRGVSKGKEGVERHEQETEHSINELLVFTTEHLPHLLGSGSHG